MTLTEKDKIYYNIWCCAFRRRYNAKIKENWKLYDREHSTVLMCLNIAKWIEFEESKRMIK